MGIFLQINPDSERVGTNQRDTALRAYIAMRPAYRTWRYRMLRKRDPSAKDGRKARTSSTANSATIKLAHDGQRINASLTRVRLSLRERSYLT